MILEIFDRNELTVIGLAAVAELLIFSTMVYVAAPLLDDPGLGAGERWEVPEEIIIKVVNRMDRTLGLRISLDGSEPVWSNLSAYGHLVLGPLDRGPEHTYIFWFSTSDGAAGKRAIISSICFNVIVLGPDDVHYELIG